ncbi:hypothetical protein Y032_0001g10 [Ancylostoma ceylanicum]|uniref:Uncharacterized protein n=1 Tax=Ancylostoma ceylanicum TaxID=53326 RepID=A0A016W1R3_9BILA|nr:hypothetical protein Y032_0001g10 [Ancylostoma ceylanicum]
MVIFLLTLLVVTIYPVVSLKCHSCSGADFLPSKVAEAMASMNLSTTAPTQGNCKGTSGSDVCTNGLFCIKKTVRYTIKYNSLSFNWDTYTKGCASVREDNAGVPTNTCYDISTTDKGGYTQSVMRRKAERGELYDWPVG